MRIKVMIWVIRTGYQYCLICKMKILLIIVLSVLMFYCSPTSSDNAPRPEKIRMVQRTADTAFVDIEKGIDAIEEDNGLVLMWYQPENQTSIDHYNIYRSTDPDGLVNFNRLTATDLFFTDTTYTDRSLNLETLYSYFVTAVNEDSQESLPSDTVRYRLIEKAELSNPGDGEVLTDPAEIIFLGSFTNGIAQSSVLRIERLVGSTFRELIYLQYKPNFDNYDGTVQYTLPEAVLRNYFESGEEYTWRIDLIRDLEFWGSESETRTFRIIWGS